MTYFQQVLMWFNTLPLARKLNLCLAFLAIFVITALVSWFTLSPSYAVLFNHLEEEDASRITSQLEQEQITYQLRGAGHDILIEKSLVEKTRLKLMGKDLQLNSSLGFELFDKSDFGMTDFSQKINYQRALQGELERTITSLDEIRQARVHLVIPENNLFNQHTNQPKAAVTLHLKKPLTQKQVGSIQQLVSASVAHLQVKQVVVVDQNGHTLTKSEEDNTSSHLSTKKSIEHYLNDKVMQMLRTIYSEEEVMVKIDASLNYDELQRERIKPQSEGLITHEKESTHLTPGKNEKDKSNQDITREKSYQFGSEKERFKRASGALEKLSISVVLPQTSNQNTLDKVQQLVKSTVGFDSKRGDTISVVALINPTTPSLLPVIPIPLHSEPIKPIDYPVIAFVFILLTLGVIATTKRIRNKRRRLLLIELTHWLNHHE